MFAMSARILDHMQSRSRSGNGGADDGGEVARRISAAAFRAEVHQRLLGLEREMAEVKSRLNSLIYLVAGAVLAQVVVKVMA